MTVWMPPGGIRVDLARAQGEVDRWIGQFKEGYWHPLTLMARLAEEVGELAREVNHRYGQKPKRQDEKDQDLEEELGDILFVLCCLANVADVDLGRAFQRTMAKLYARDAYRFPRKDGGGAAGGDGRV